MHERRRLILFALLLTPIVVFGSMVFHINGSADGPYPPPATSSPSAPQNPTSFLYLPSIMHIISPPAAPSYYVMDVNTTHWYDLGYALGLHDRNTPGVQDNLVILDYGYPKKQGSTYGVKLVFDPSGTFYSTDQVVSTAIAFAQGYYLGTGLDENSKVHMVIGVSNCCNEDTISFFQGHGTAWGQVLNSITSTQRRKYIA